MTEQKVLSKTWASIAAAAVGAATCSDAIPDSVSRPVRVSGDKHLHLAIEDEEDEEPVWCQQTFRCPHGARSRGNIIQGLGLCAGPHYASKKCVSGCCVHGVPPGKHCGFCAKDGERYGWDGSVGGCKCLKCFTMD